MFSHPAQPRRDSTTHDGGMSLQVGSRVRVTPNCRAARLAGRTGAVVSLGRQVERKLSSRTLALRPSLTLALRSTVTLTLTPTLTLALDPSPHPRPTPNPHLDCRQVELKLDGDDNQISKVNRNEV